MGGMSSNLYSQIGSSIGGTANYFINRTATNHAADQSMTAQNNANALYQDLYGQTQGDYKPYMEGGVSAYDALLRTYGLGKDQGGEADYSAFQNSPDYQFALQQGQTSLDRSAASRGRLFSGQQVKASQAYGQGMANQQLGSYRTGLGNLSNMGLTATNALTGYRQGYGNQLGQGLTNLGDISAARELGLAAAHRQWYQDMGDTWGAGPNNSNQGGGQQGGNALGGGFGSSAYGQQWGGGSGQTGGPPSNASMYQWGNFQSGGGWGK